MKSYETVFILNPVLSVSQASEVVDHFVKLITESNSTVVNVEQWGIRKLAYSIQKKSTGFYNLIEFEAEPTFIDVLETEFRRNDSVIRFLTTSLDKHALVYNERRRNGAFDKKKEKEEKQPSN